jgi:hypothetical protein
LASIAPALVTIAWWVAAYCTASLKLITEHVARTQALMELLKPKRFDGHVEEYKLQFSFNGAVYSILWSRSRH